MESAEDLVRLAETFASSISDLSGEHLDFSPGSLAALDSLVDQWLHLAEVYAGAEALDLSAYALPTAAYAGEVFRRALGGEWYISEAPSAPPHLVLAGRFRLDVVQLVERFYRRASPPSLWDLYQAIERELERQPRPESDVDP